MLVLCSRLVCFARRLLFCMFSVVFMFGLLVGLIWVGCYSVVYLFVGFGGCWFNTLVVLLVIVVVVGLLL